MLQLLIAFLTCETRCRTETLIGDLSACTCFRERPPYSTTDTATSLPSVSNLFCQEMQATGQIFKKRMQSCSAIFSGISFVVDNGRHPSKGIRIYLTVSSFREFNSPCRCRRSFAAARTPHQSNAQQKLTVRIIERFPSQQSSFAAPFTVVGVKSARYIRHPAVFL
jgi:hypothetical protein